MESAPLLSTPEEELSYLRAQVAEKEQEIALTHHEGPATEEFVRHATVAETLAAHQRAPAENILAPEYRLSAETAATEADAILAELDLGDAERAVLSLRAVMGEKGIKNALAVMEKMDDPQVTDDFHRYLVRYVAAGLTVSGLPETAPKMKALHMTLYEIALPEPKSETNEGRSKTLKELVSAMEQFYAGLLAVGQASAGEPGYLALELAMPASSPELQFYASIPTSKRDLFEKQLLAIFPDAHLLEQPHDYNLFAPKGSTLISIGKLMASPALPLKDYTEFDYDPLNAILNAFAKIEHAGEGSAIQLIIEPAGERYTKHYKKMLAALRKGEKHATAFNIPETAFGELVHEIGASLFSGKSKDEVKRKEGEQREVEANKSYIEAVEHKLASPIASATLRLVVSSADATRSGAVLGELEAAFNQFGNTACNKL